MTELPPLVPPRKPLQLKGSAAVAAAQRPGQRAVYESLFNVSRVNDVGPYWLRGLEIWLRARLKFLRPE